MYCLHDLQPASARFAISSVDYWLTSVHPSNESTRLSPNLLILIPQAMVRSKDSCSSHNDRQHASAVTARSEAANLPGSGRLFVASGGLLMPTRRDRQATRPRRVVLYP